MARIRVLQVIPKLVYGGAERLVVQLSHGLDPSRFNVTVVSFNDPLGTDLESELADNGIPLLHLGKKPGFDPLLFRRINRLLQSYRADVVHTHIHALPYALPAMLFRRIPAKVHTVHNVAEKEADRIRAHIHRLAFRLGVVPVAIAAELTRGIQEFYGVTDCPIIPNGIPVKTFREPVTPRQVWRARERLGADDWIILTIGRLAPQKDHQLLLQAFARVHAEESSARLIVVGDGELKPELEATIERLGLQDVVTLAGNRYDVPDLLGATDLFVLSSAYEGNPLTIMEAMAAGKPVISTAVGAVPSLIRNAETGRLVSHGDVEALAAAMLESRRSPESARRMGRAATAWAEEHFELSLMARRYADLYEQLLEAQ